MSGRAATNHVLTLHYHLYSTRPPSSEDWTRRTNIGINHLGCILQYPGQPRMFQILIKRSTPTWHDLMKDLPGSPAILGQNDALLVIVNMSVWLIYCSSCMLYFIFIILFAWEIIWTRFFKNLVRMQRHLALQGFVCYVRKTTSFPQTWNNIVMVCNGNEAYHPKRQVNFGAEHLHVMHGTPFGCGPHTFSCKCAFPGIQDRIYGNSSPFWSSADIISCHMHHHTAVARCITETEKNHWTLNLHLHNSFGIFGWTTFSR